MTESLTDPRASQSFVIVSKEQMNALYLLLFELIKQMAEDFGRIALGQTER